MKAEKTREHLHRPDVRLERALSVLTDAIRERWPDARLEVFRGDDPDGIYLRAIVDISDPDEVTDAIGDQLLAMQVDEGLPIYATAIRPLERVLDEQRQRLATRSLVAGRAMARP